MCYNINQDDKKRALYTGREIAAACAAISELVAKNRKRYTFKEVIGLASIYLIAALKARQVETGRDLTIIYNEKTSATLYEISDPLQAIDAGLDDLPGGNA